MVVAGIWESCAEWQQRQQHSGKLALKQRYSQDDGSCRSLFRRTGGEAGNHWVTQQDDITASGIIYSDRQGQS